MKPVLHVDFSDFGTQMVKTDNRFTRLLSQRYDVRISDQPDLLIHSHDSEVHRLYTCKKVFYTVEAYRPNLEISDYSITQLELNDPRNLRLPNYTNRVTAEELIKAPDEEDAVVAQKTKFCCFFTSHARSQLRLKFFEKLSKYKQVDSAGSYLNNIGQRIPNDRAAKIQFMRQYKFYMAFENDLVPWYTTEKIGEGMAARCVPIYWGNPHVAKDFNPKSFLNYSDFPSEDALIERIAEIDRDENLYRQYLREPFFYGNKPSEFFDDERTLNFFTRCIEDKTKTVGSRKSVFGSWVLLKRNKRHVRK
jgi:alpha(1,3/1,4) fucosyltransferase